MATPSQLIGQTAEARGWKVTAEYVDQVSGSKDSRPALNSLMDDATKRRIDGVVIWKLDRFGRSLRHLVNALAELEAQCRIRQLARQPGPVDAFRPADVPDHRRHD